MSPLVYIVATLLEPGIIKEMVTPFGKDLTATEAAAIQNDTGAISRRIAAQLVTAVKNALAANPRVIEDMCRAHDEEDAAQKGEPSPWRAPDDDPISEEVWRSERRAAMLCALKVVGLA